ncbi:MAG TPA: hypothetical protein VM553_00725 [Dongiaceae bacterium]|nr:hypothetical protein [Dongiaceae bacterium]
MPRRLFPLNMRLLAAFCLSLLLSNVSLATELTDQTIQQWVGAYKAVLVFCKGQDKKDLEFMNQQYTPDMGNLFTDALTRMKGQPIYSDFSGVLGANGYKDPMEWAGQGDRIMAATMASELEKSGKASGAQKVQMQQAMQTLQNNPNLTPQQKAQMQQIMGMGNQMIDVAEKVPPADKAAVQRNEALIRSIMVDARPKS